MMKRVISRIFLVGGVLFLLNAIFGRYLVLPGYLDSLAAGQATLGEVSQTVSGWKVARYLLWAYSFKLGIYCFGLGLLVPLVMGTGRKWAIALGGFVYIAFAYMPLPAPASLVFGLAGGLMTVAMLYILVRWARLRPTLPAPERVAADYRLAGYFFLAMATYTLCPFMGVKTFALAPEKMIAYGLQAEAASFAFHLLIELALGWLFIGLSHWQLARQPAADKQQALSWDSAL
ncbi:MAG: hypothetical protein KDE34_03890 [Anaerolineales bacterium]|nr:hypothetical protein [Anaerolineales bacterium]MCB8963219.1 hypothetical protein [Ardenticatenales bacterium]